VVPDEQFDADWLLPDRGRAALREKKCSLLDPGAGGCRQRLPL
jgi:hypothetical protein